MSTKALLLACLLMPLTAFSASYHAYGTHRTITTIIMVKSGRLGRDTVVGEIRSGEEETSSVLTAGELTDLFDSKELWTSNWASGIQGPWFNGKQVASMVANFDKRKIFLGWRFRTDEWIEDNMSAVGIILVPKSEGPERQFQYSALVEIQRDQPKNQLLMDFIIDSQTKLDCPTQVVNPALPDLKAGLGIAGKDVCDVQHSFSWLPVHFNV